MQYHIFLHIKNLRFSKNFCQNDIFLKMYSVNVFLVFTRHFGGPNWRRCQTIVTLRGRTNSKWKFRETFPYLTHTQIPQIHGSALLQSFIWRLGDEIWKKSFSRCVFFAVTLSLFFYWFTRIFLGIKMLQRLCAQKIHLKPAPPSSLDKVSVSFENSTQTIFVCFINTCHYVHH